MKVSELSGAKLDYWVARAEGWVRDPYRPNEEMQLRRDFKSPDLNGSRFIGVSDGGSGRLCIAGTREGIRKDALFSPSTLWAQAGPIIDDNAIGFHPISDAEWMAEEYMTGWTGRGPTPLVAAMRAYVASKFGDEVADEEGEQA